jgi:hypothetical protein
MAGTSPQALVNLGAGGEEGLKAFGRSKREEADLQKQLLQQSGDREKAKFGRETQLQGQRLTALGQIYNRQAIEATAKAARDAAAGGKEERNLIRAGALINSDSTIKGLRDQQAKSGYSPGTPEYDWYDKKITQRENQIYKTVGVNVPEIAPSDIPFPKPEEKPGFFDRIFGGSKPAAPAKTPGVMRFDERGNEIK